MGRFDKYTEFEVEGTMIMKYFGNGGEVVIPEGITDVFFEVFECNSRITSVVIPSTFTDTSLYTFANCTRLEDAILCEGVSEIGSFCFAHCNALKNILLPKSLTRINAGAFIDCAQLTIYYAGSKEEWERIEIEADISNVPVIFNSTL